MKKCRVFGGKLFVGKMVVVVLIVGRMIIMGMFAGGCRGPQGRCAIDEHREYASGIRYLSITGEEAELPASRPVPSADTPGRERFAEFKENEFLEVKSNPLSTFGLDVDTASYTTMRRYLTEMKRRPPKDSVRIEEYVNYFSYDYAGPTGDVPVAVACELGVCPWNAAHKLLRVGVQAKRVPKESIPPCNLVFLIETSRVP